MFSWKTFPSSLGFFFFFTTLSSLPLSIREKQASSATRSSVSPLSASQTPWLVASSSSLSRSSRSCSASWRRVSRKREQKERGCEIGLYCPRGERDVETSSSNKTVPSLSSAKASNAPAQLLENRNQIRYKRLRHHEWEQNRPEERVLRGARRFLMGRKLFGRATTSLFDFRVPPLIFSRRTCSSPSQQKKKKKTPSSTRPHRQVPQKQQARKRHEGPGLRVDRRRPQDAARGRRGAGPVLARPGVPRGDDRVGQPLGAQRGAQGNRARPGAREVHARDRRGRQVSLSCCCCCCCWRRRWRGREEENGELRERERERERRRSLDQKPLFLSYKKKTQTQARRHPAPRGGLPAPVAPSGSGTCPRRAARPCSRALVEEGQGGRRQGGAQGSQGRAASQGPEEEGGQARRRRRRGCRPQEGRQGSRSGSGRPRRRPGPGPHRFVRRLRGICRRWPRRRAPAPAPRDGAHPGRRRRQRAALPHRPERRGALPLEEERGGVCVCA